MTKAAHKQLGHLDNDGTRPLWQEDYQDLPDPPDEADFLSNDKEEESPAGEKIARFFNAEEYQYLLCKSLSALELKGPPQEENPQELDTDPKNISKERGEYFPYQSSKEKVFPFLYFSNAR